MTSFKTRIENLKSRLLKPLLNSNYEPSKLRSRINGGEPVKGSYAIKLSHSHLEAWGNPKAKRKILYIPGGGFCFGPHDRYRHFLNDMGESLDAKVFLLHYRLAPEHPFPAAFEDTLEALKRVDQGEDPVVIMADSAAAALAISTLMCVRDEKTNSNVSCAVYLSAFTDLALTGMSLVTNARKDPMFSAEALIHKVNHYLQGHNPTDPAASPFWGKLNELPPALFMVGSTEVLYDDSSRMAAAGREAGCDFQISCYKGAPHIFPINNKLPEARRAKEEITEFVRQQLENVT